MAISCIYLQNKELNPFEMAKKALYIFNPEHDLALASGETNYMAPASARQMALELALLPMWYAGEEEMVLAPSAYNLDHIKKMRELLGLSVHLMTEPELASGTDLDIRPWGWDFAVRKRLSDLGVGEGKLPSAGQLDKLRSCSHRSCAVELLPRLRLGDSFCGESFYLRFPEEWKSFVESHDTCLLKAPLSGSGKGLNWCKGIYTPSISGWCSRIGNQQGGVIGEPIYNKVEDFAMEFRSSGGRFRFAGYSRFRTGGSGAYEGNLLISDAVIERNLSDYIPVEEVHKLRDCLERELSLRFGAVYDGYLGVDMMVCRFLESPVYRIHPCVEINLRMNMGVVARHLYDRYISPASAGVFQIGYHPTAGAAWSTHKEMEEAYPLRIERGRICSGYLPLVPVHKKSNYRAWILISSLPPAVSLYSGFLG